MNPLLTEKSACKIYLYDPKVEGADIYIEGIVDSVDHTNGVYLVTCTKDCTVSDEFKARNPEMKKLTRVGSQIKVPISPESGDFAGRIRLI